MELQGKVWVKLSIYVMDIIRGELKAEFLDMYINAGLDLRRYKYRIHWRKRLYMKKIITIGIMLLYIMGAAGCADNQEGDNFSFYIGVEEDNTHEVVFGNLEADINMYHVMEREVKDNAILFLCELDDEENDTVLKQTIQIEVQAYTDERISDYETARAYFDEVLEEYDFKYYQDIKDFNGVTEIYVAIQEEMMYCIFNMQNESYLITTDATNLLSLLHGYGLNDCLQRECIVEHIECSEDREIEVYKDIQYPEMCARYCFGKEREYWADYQILSMDDRSYQMRFSLYVQSNMIQTLEWNSYFVKYPEFIDVNEDGYVDMKVVMDSAPAYDIVELYIWDGEKNCFEKVICEEQLAHIESKEGNLWNWTRSGEGYILQIFSWENNVLVKESEEVIMPDANEVISPGMKLETVLEKLEQSGIIIERHNMQYYASGIELEKMGIARLEWDSNETITYVNTVVDTGKVDELQDYELVIKEEQFVYCDEERNVNIVIDYPVIEAGNHQETTEQMNSSIEETVQEILAAEEVSGLDNISLDIEYSLKSVESERFSILWEGVVTTPDGEYEVRKALTYNMLKNSIVLEIEENGWTNEQLASELSWQLELEEAVAAKILSEKQYEFYVTPLYLVVIYEDKETQEYRTASMFR